MEREGARAEERERDRKEVVRPNEKSKVRQEFRRVESKGEREKEKESVGSEKRETTHPERIIYVFQSVVSCHTDETHATTHHHPDYAENSLFLSLSLLSHVERVGGEGEKGRDREKEGKSADRTKPG